MRHVFYFDRENFRSSKEFWTLVLPPYRSEGVRAGKQLLCEILNAHGHVYLRQFDAQEPRHALVWMKYKDMQPLICTPTNENRVWSGVQGKESIHLMAEGHIGMTAHVTFEFFLGTHRCIRKSLMIRDWSAVEVVLYRRDEVMTANLMSISRVVYC